jgi:phosphate/sulfate permease
MMRNFVRILAFVLLIGTTVIFVLKIKLNIPISHIHLIIFFIIGVISLFWANLRNKTSEK